LRVRRKFDNFENRMKKSENRNWDELIKTRPATERDIPEMLAIEVQSFPSPWSGEMFEKELTLDFSRRLVAEMKADKSVAGFVLCRMSGPVADIMTIAVKPDLRKSGLGGYILNKMMAEMVSLGVTEVWLEVRPGNLAAQALYLKSGIKKTGVRTKYYTDTGEDAIIMKREL
jgi:[ribosomal protein S18]-alanine N-acetyltransferase